MQTAIDQASAWLHAARRVAVLTGAGVSRESGIPTFREAGTGIWARSNPYQVASAVGFAENPDESWRWHEHLRDLVRRAQPNPGHVALAQLEALIPRVVVITQNIDDLHQRAGSTDILPIHGDLMANRCFFNCLGEPTLLAWDDLVDYRPGAGVPACPHCGRWVRPDVVWFGEYLPPEVIDRAFAEAQRADVLLVVGTSGTVQPAASIPFVAQEAGVLVIDVNPAPDELTTMADLWLQGPSGQVLPRLVAALQRRTNERLANAE